MRAINLARRSPSQDLESGLRALGIATDPLCPAAAALDAGAERLDRAPKVWKPVQSVWATISSRWEPLHNGSATLSSGRERIARSDRSCQSE
jgi:hypothetical protein